LKLAFVALFAFVAGFAVRDETMPQAEAAPYSCNKERDAADRYAYMVANVLNGGGLRTPERIVKCYVRYKRST
jgi:hypothetical protein